jgi:hypothetical protein
MTSILSEKEYQHFIMDRLSQDNSYIVRKATSYDRLFAMDRELLFQFLNDTQPPQNLQSRPGGYPRQFYQCRGHKSAR